MIDMYNEAPIMHWYEVKGNVDGQYVLVWRLGKQFAGFLREPDYETIERYNMIEIGQGDMTYIEGLS